MPATSTASKIRGLLSKGMKPQAVADKLKIKVASVYTTRWLDKNKNKAKRKPKAKAKTNGQPTPEFALTPPPAPFNLREFIHAELRSQVQAEVAKVLAGG